jgi:hypothetical protein
VSSSVGTRSNQALEQTQRFCVEYHVGVHGVFLVRQVRAIRLRALAVHLVRCEVDEVATQLGSCLFHEFAGGEVVERFIALSGPSREEAPALSASTDHDQGVAGHRHKMKPRHEIVGWNARQVGRASIRVVDVGVREESRKALRPIVRVRVHVRSMAPASGDDRTSA